VLVQGQRRRGCWLHGMVSCEAFLEVLLGFSSVLVGLFEVGDGVLYRSVVVVEELSVIDHVFHDSAAAEHVHEGSNVRHVGDGIVAFGGEFAAPSAVGKYGVNEGVWVPGGFRALRFRVRSCWVISPWFAMMCWRISRGVTLA
jgi:hypothetical protein